MHFLLFALAVACLVAGFLGFAAGGIPTIVFWVLAGVFILLGWKARPMSQRQQEDRAMRER
jgi:membrane protein implicated in regulation of membrane protease activity